MRRAWLWGSSFLAAFMGVVICVYACVSAFTMTGQENAIRAGSFFGLLFAAEKLFADAKTQRQKLINMPMIGRRRDR